MSKHSQIVDVLKEIAAKKRAVVSESKLEQIASNLLELSFPSKYDVQQTIKVGDYILKEAIDTSDTDFLINQILNILKKS